MTVVASYLPELMIVKIGPILRLFDDQGQPVAFPTAEAFGFLFHEYAHYLHNISTASGIGVLINTLDHWRCFRFTHNTTGYSNGSKVLPPGQQEYLKNLLACLRAARWANSPAVRNGFRPVSMTVLSFKPEPEVKSEGEIVLTAIKYEATITNSHGETETVSGSIGTLELLESAAWLLEKRVVSAVSPSDQTSTPKVFPYRVVESFVEHVMPGVGDDTVLACVLAALQSSDAPAALLEVLDIMSQADGKNPTDVLRGCADNAVKSNKPHIEEAFDKIEHEFSGDSLMALAIRRIIATAREAFRLREADPFFELDFIKQLGERTMSIDDLMRSIPSCAVLQRNNGSDDQLQRDFLLSFLPANTGGIDPEDGLRVIHCIFDYLERHRDIDALKSTDNARRVPCPFFTTCDLALRQKEASICRETPWEAADWPEWDERDTCWYGAGVRITRPPS